MDLSWDVTVSVRYKGKRKFHDVSMKRTFPLQIMEVSSNAAPVAFWWRKEYGPEAQYAYRVMDGRLLVPVHLSEKASSRLVSSKIDGMARPVSDHPRILDLAAYVEAVRDGESSVPFDSLDDGKRSTGLTSLPDGIVEVRDATTDRLHQQLSEVFENIVAVDGVAHRFVEMPLIEVSEFDLRVRSKDFYSAAIFTIDKADEALAVAADHRRWSGYPDPSSYAPEIVRPDLVPSVDLVKRRREVVASHILGSSSSSSGGRDRSSAFAALPRDVLIAYARLREAKGAGADLEQPLNDFIATNALSSGYVFDRDWFGRNMRFLDEPAPVEFNRCA